MNKNRCSLSLLYEIGEYSKRDAWKEKYTRYGKEEQESAKGDR